MSTIEPTTSQGWTDVLHDLTAREQHLNGVVDDATETIRRHALARSRSEPTAVSISSEAEAAKAAAQQDLEALAPAISEANAKRGACQAEERQADNARRAAENVERARQLIAMDLDLLRAVSTLCELINKRHDQFAELATLMGKRQKVGLVIGGGSVESVLAHALAGVQEVGGRSGVLSLNHSPRALFCFIQRDCDLFGVALPDEALDLDVEDFFTRNMRKLG
jgi:hypothetical protein